MMRAFFALTALAISMNVAAQTPMEAAREALWASHGGGTHWAVMGEQLEYLYGPHDPALALEGQAWYGSDINKLWLKTHGTYETTEHAWEDLELQMLYSRAVRPFWDAQIGVRADIGPDPKREYLALGLQGLAPYWFEVDANLFVSTRGDVSARLEAEYDLRLSRSLVLQPRVELNAAFSDDTGIGIGIASGFTHAEAGLRLRYEITPQIAPYLGVTWERAFGGTADLAEDEERTALVAGLRFWF